jgi:hypothetical protein
MTVQSMTVFCCPSPTHSMKLIAISPSAPERTARMTRGSTMAAGVATETWRLERTFGRKHGPEQAGPSARIAVSTLTRLSLRAATQA